jgi:hypothetical protein
MPNIKYLEQQNQKLTKLSEFKIAETRKYRKSDIYMQ